ncbi:MAG: hypothetical protein PHZ00_05230 [Candidatus Peribacteraceae bacterium]|nr:hypothetical protein [Candidatus Peribacteraceae bacterium]
MSPIPETIIGHARQRNELLKDIECGNVAHAYLFSGREHLGKFTIARWFAWQLLSAHLPSDERGTVKDQIERLIHPDFLCVDLLWIEKIQEDWSVISKTSNIPQAHRSKEKPAKTDQISVDDVHALLGRLADSRTSPYCCCIVRSVERMGREAANAFLKTLEEPPSKTVFLLTTDMEQSLLPTVVSRTRVVRFSPLPERELRPLLEGYAEEDAGFILHLANGAPGLLIELLENPESLRRHKQLHSQARQFWQTRSLKDRLVTLMTVAERKTNADDLILHLGLALRELKDTPEKPQWTQFYTALIRGMETNAHRGLLLERFALAVTEER